MRHAGRLFIAALWGVGLVTGIVVAQAPELLQPLPTPHLMLPLLVAFVLDLALRPATTAGKIEPITMNERGIAVIGAGLIGLTVTALAGQAAAPVQAAVEAFPTRAGSAPCGAPPAGFALSGFVSSWLAASRGGPCRGEAPAIAVPAM